MNNYEYIIASLPELQRDTDQCDIEALTAGIREQLSGKDNALVDKLLGGWDDERLDEEFYRDALSSGNRFIRGYFSFDLSVRNAKVAWLNKTLGRPEGMDMIIIPQQDDEGFDRAAELASVLEGTDILAKERGLDDLMWDEADRLTQMDVFDIELILAFIVKLQIIGRWLKLDPRSGRELFRKLVEEIKNTRTI